ncbi:disintegrin and metalloproteinase domain-containing protein 9-like protein [Willisornis vidua]|uniref:Disintegrin and metalloproteinase domain-containing protein 9-like protein n=1 Tax=Willisornis vidua TaxID=1566151 RepID=A0ABQ9DHS7_9PASS|nr:disintegrin and metalloproteinase domain-containing protein 9-like protein [Willisornis vidua]
MLIFALSKHDPRALEETEQIKLSRGSQVLDWGILYIGGKWYGMEPLNTSSTFEHVFYELEDKQDMPFHCGVLNGSLQYEKMFVKQAVKYTFSSNTTSSRDKLLREKRAVLPQKSYVELFVVVDNKRFLLKNSDPAAVQKETVELINYVDGMYRPLNIQIVLVGLEIWTDGNHISVMDGSAGDVLGRFVSWRQKDLLKRSRNDVGHLIIGSRNFSTCSADDFETLILNGGGNCLRNPPKTSNVYREPVCGNNVVDNNEECDCGKPQFRVAGAECRAKRDFCDLPEYCNGTNAYCPEDVYIMNGHPCSNSKAYCYYGVCQSFDSQCESIYGKGARKAPDICFEKANIKGDRFGNCGMKGGVYKKCPVQHSLCGKLQCTSVSLQNLPAWSVVNNASGVLCWSSDFDLGSDIPDPAQVHDGTACGENKACVGFECVDATYLGYSCDVKQKCNNNGVCNNNGNCHCNAGWAPPFCNESGYGGSIDSGPAHPDTSLRDGLLIFFFLVLPVIIVAALAIIKRDAIRRTFCRKSRRQHRDNNVQEAKQDNKPCHDTRNNQGPGWKRSRRELLQCLERLLRALLRGAPLPGPDEPGWERFLRCCRREGLLEAAQGPRPLCLLLDDNFYYQSMRYELYQLARTYSLGFCQLFLECPLECCLQRNRLRSDPVPEQTIHLMASKIEMPDLKKNTWEQNSLILRSSDYISEDNEQIINLLATALANPVRPNEEDTEQKEADRAICAASAVHQADQTCRRVISQAMKDARDKNILPVEMKSLAEELNKLKAEFLEDLRQGKTLKTQNSDPVTSAISSFQRFIFA